MLTAIDHRIIGGIICGAIILISTVLICVKYVLRNKNKNDDKK